MYIRRKSVSLSVTSDKSTTYSTSFNGVLYGVAYIPPSAGAFGTTNIVKIYNERSTAMHMFSFPGSTTPQMYYPTVAMHGSTGAALASTITGRIPCLSYDRLKINVEASSNGSAAKTATLYLYLQGW